MKKLVLFSVELQDLTGDFSFYPGAVDFQEKYRSYETDYSYYSFDVAGNQWREAENDLRKAGLRYEKSYRLEMDADEIAAHPVHNLAIPSLYDLVVAKKEQPALSPEAGDFPISQDYGSGVLVARAEILDQLSRLGFGLKDSDSRTVTVKKKQYRILTKAPSLATPMLIGNAGAVKENAGQAGTFYLEGWDGRSSLPQEAVDFVKANHLVAAYLIEYEGRVYRQGSPNYLISGEFASFLSKGFQPVYIIPMTFDLV